MDVRSRYAVCQNVLRGGDLATNVAWAAEAGAGGIGLDAVDVQAVGVDAAMVMLADRSLTVSSLMRAVGVVLNDDDPGRHEAHVADVVALSGALGGPPVLVTTGPLGDLTPAEADRRCRAWFARMAPIAADGGVRLMLEPVHPLLRWASYVHTLRHGAELTGGLPGTGMLLDVGHLFWDRHLLDDVAAHVDQLASVQIDDVDGEAMREYRYARVQLGQGVLPLAEIVAAIEEAGFRGWYENEIGARVPRAERPTFVRTGGEWLAGAVGSPLRPTPGRAVSATE